MLFFLNLLTLLLLTEITIYTYFIITNPTVAIALMLFRNIIIDKFI